MKKQTIPLGKILNIPIGLDYSWFLIFALITWTLATSYFPAEFKNWPLMEYWLVGGITAIMLFVSVLLHELGHSVIALHYKISVERITLFIFGGIAQIGSEPPNAASEFWIAIAGPIVSFLLAGLFFGLELVIKSIAPVFALAKYLAYINGTLALFNLIPGFPLDGGRIFRALVWGISRSYHRATAIAAGLGQVIAFLFILVGVWMLFSGNPIGGIWIAFIGWFLVSAANAEVQQLNLHEILSNHTVSQAMSRNYAIISADTTLQELLDQHILGTGRRFFVVKRGAFVVGLLPPSNLRNIPPEDWSNRTAEQVMIPIQQIHSIQPDEDLWEAVKEMEKDNVGQLPVMSNSEVMGILTRETVNQYLRSLRQAA
jgi:Zn-dependent protease